jgi:hypothetical protein
MLDDAPIAWATISGRNLLPRPTALKLEAMQHRLSA